MNIKRKPLAKGMCFRCEFRAQFHEVGHAPRYECGTDSSYVGCYMYKPVAPVVLEPNKGDKRSVKLPAMIRGRSQGIAVADCQTVYKQLPDNQYILLARPRRCK